MLWLDLLRSQETNKENGAEAGKSRKWEQAEKKISRKKLQNNENCGASKRLFLLLKMELDK